MRVPLSWLSEYIDVVLPPERLAEVLTLGGLVVERILRPTAGVRGVVVARVERVAPVPGSDRLSLVEVFDGQERHEVVCGASNFAPGDLVPAALPGATLPSPDPDRPLQIGRKRLMGVTSHGMLASARELGVGEDHRGIWVLGPDAPLGADLAAWLSLDDAVLELDLNPDRGYAQSMLGVAWDVAALTGAALRLPEAPPAASGDPGVPVAIADPDRCPRFDARRIEGLTVRPSPAWLQRRLAAAGVRPISTVVDATNHTMLEVGNPIHAYDTALLAGPRIEVRTARPGESLLTLDGVERALDPDDLVIADADGPVALAGVMGGERTEISDATTDVLLETANFSARTVLRTARRHQLFTEGSRRWEKQVPPEHVPLAAGRCAALITRLAGGTVTGAADSYPRPRERLVITLRTPRARRRLGMALADDRQRALLEAIGCAVAPAGEGPGTGAGDGVLTVTPPAYRPDLRIEEDLYEEIARIEGYDRIPERVPSSGRAGGRTPQHVAVVAVRRALAGAGWAEVQAFPFAAPADFDALGLPADDDRRRAVVLTNPLSKEESVLATTLLPGLLRIVRRNVNRQTTDVAVFQAARAFRAPTPEEPGAPGGAPGAVDPPTLPAEPFLLGFAACGHLELPRWDRPGRRADVYDLLGAADVARRAVGLGPLAVAATDEPPFHPGRAARLACDGLDLGVVGELHPRVVAALELPARTLAGELRLDRLVAGGVRPAVPPVPSPLPPLRLDLAVVVAAGVPAAAVEATVRAAAGERLVACDLFDVYRGPSIGEGRVSLAYALRLEDPARQLTDADAHEVIERVDAAVRDRLGGHLRR